MPLRVVGAGLGRTGTSSLQAALDQLGFGPCHHMREVGKYPEVLPLWERAAAGEPVDWDVIYGEHRSAVDYPTCAFWEELVAFYPDAKVILTHRDPEAWWNSVMQTIYLASGAERDPDTPMRRVLHTRVWQGWFHGRMRDKDYAMQRFVDHLEAVRAAIPTERLLDYQVSEGWEPLCRFLDVPVPDEPFPRKNTRQEFIEHMRQNQAARGE